MEFSMFSEKSGTQNFDTLARGETGDEDKLIM
jgi:hypothetical protein